MKSSEQVQREYYTDSALNYDCNHADGAHDLQHDFALKVLLGILIGNDFSSVLDIGSGTGRAILFINEHAPKIRVVGVEPVEELRNVALKKGVQPEALVEGNGYDLPFADNHFDIVTSFGVLHHVKRPAIVIEEMLRVAKIGIFISDSNNYGQGSFFLKAFKQTLRALRLWRAFDFFRTKGRGYQISSDDGLFYSYSLFDNYDQIERACKHVHIINTENAGRNLFRTSGHIALLGIK